MGIQTNNHKDRLIFSILNHGSKMPHDKKCSSKFPSRKTLASRKWNLDTVTKILKCVQTNWCRKQRKAFKIEKSVVLAEYFKQQTDCNRRKISKSRRSPLQRGISCILISLSNKWEPCHRVSHVILRTAMKRYFQLPCSCKQPRNPEEMVTFKNMGAVLTKIQKH